MRRRPYRVVLFDEIEKAHPEVWNALLQILDDGRLTDGQGRVVDFRNTVLIMTSNLGTEFASGSGSVGFLSQKNGSIDENDSKIQKALKDTFRPEFLNRIDEIIIFSQLTTEDMGKIVDLQMDEIQERLAEYGLTVNLTEEARNWLANQGFDPAFGARPLKRAMQKHIESPLSVKMLRGDFSNGDCVNVDATEDNGLEFSAISEKKSGNKTKDKKNKNEVPAEEKVEVA